MKRRRSKTITIRFRANGEELRSEFERWKAAEARRDACPSHGFERTADAHERWTCAHCGVSAGRDYVAGFASGLRAAGRDPAGFISDYGEWR